MAVHFHEGSRAILARKIQLVFIEMNGPDEVVYCCIRFYVMFRLTKGIRKTTRRLGMFRDAAIIILCAGTQNFATAFN